MKLSFHYKLKPQREYTFLLRLLQVSRISNVNCRPENVEWNGLYLCIANDN